MNKKNFKIILVEDDQYIGSIISKKFVDAGYEVNRISNGDDARVLFADTEKMQDIKAILLDLVIPLADGFELLTLLKSSASTSQIPVLILSNVGEDEKKEEGLRLGATDFLIKASNTPAFIVDRVRKMIEN